MKELEVLVRLSVPFNNVLIVGANGTFNAGANGGNLRMNAGLDVVMLELIAVRFICSGD